MTPTAFTDELLARGFTRNGSQFNLSEHKIHVLVNPDRIYVSLRYPNNGYWNLKETAQFPNSPKFREGAMLLIVSLQGDKT